MARADRTTHADQPADIRVTAAELFAAMDLTRPGLHAVRRAVDAGDPDAAARAWAAYFSKRPKPTVHFNRKAWATYMHREFPAVAEAMIRSADAVAGGDFSHGPLNLPIDGPCPGGHIHWLHNPKRDTNYVSMVGSQWFMNPLGRAYLLTGDERYARTFAWLWESWFDHQADIVACQGGLGFNPIYHAYYPGIQARILTDNYYALARSPALTPTIHVKVMRQLLACVRFLERQERRYRIGNQQVAAVLGLGTVGLVFPEFTDAPTWVDRAESLMGAHLRNDFFPDGGHRELCTQYHKTILRDVGYVALISQVNGRPSPLLVGRNRSALERAYDWLARLVMPTGQTPPLHSAVYATDYAVHLLVSAHYLNRTDHAWLADRFWKRGVVPNQKSPLALAAYLLAPPLSASRPGRRRPEPPGYASTHLDTSGFAVLRTGWEPTDRYLVFQYGWANTGHAYPGAMSFLLETNGELVATHPGSPRSYRHPAYKYCHSTVSHNTVTIDGESYAAVKGIAPGGHLDRHVDLPGLWYVDAHHDGYGKTVGVVHQRRIVAIADGPILWVDDLRGGAGHQAQWNFHTPLRAFVRKDHSITLTGIKRYRLVPAPGCVTRVGHARRWAAVLPENCQPDDCGAKVNVLRLEQPIGRRGARFAVALFEGPGELLPTGRHLFRLRTSQVDYVVALGGADTIVTGEVLTAHAHLAVVALVDGQPTRAWVVDGTHLSVAGHDLLCRKRPYTGEVCVPKGR